VLFNNNPERETYAEGVERGFGTMTSSMLEAARGTGYFTPAAVGRPTTPGGHRPRTPSPVNYMIPLPRPMDSGISARPAGTYDDFGYPILGLMSKPRIAKFPTRIRPE